jgi:DNA-directed RNA polymerase subunit RPC12/RpoP
VNAIECKECGARFDGDRTEARRALWEPFSIATQQALDHGPMVCPDCVRRILDDLLAAIGRAFAA